jgi:hypothetical protein
MSGHYSEKSALCGVPTTRPGSLQVEKDVFVGALYNRV